MRRKYNMPYKGVIKLVSCLGGNDTDLNGFEWNEEGEEKKM